MTVTEQASFREQRNKVNRASLGSLVWPMTIALLLRIGLMFVSYFRTGTRIMTQGDTESYLTPGHNLFVHGVFANGGLPEIDRTPGYPIFAELSGMLFGNVLLTVCVQIMLSLISIWVAASIAGRLFRDPLAAPIAAWLFACEPLSLVSVIRIMPETLFVTLLLLCLERLLRFFTDPKLVFPLQSGILLGPATLVRPVSYYLVVPLAIALALAARQREWLRWKAPLVFAIAFLPWVAGWQIRNSVGTGYTGFSSIVEKNLYFYQAAEIEAELDHISIEQEQKKLGYPDDANYVASHPEQRTWSRIERLHFMKSQAVSVLRQHPLMYLRSHLIGVGIVALSPGATEFLQLIDAYPPTDKMPQRLVNEGIQSSIAQVAREHPGVATVMILFSGFAIFLYAAAFAGVVSKRQSAGVLILSGTALYFLMISGGAQAVARYRLPVIPELCILASGGICALYDKTKRSCRSSSAQVVLPQLRS